MADNTKIEWAKHTFNPWTGCTKISPACDHCYAESWSKRSGHVTWGHKQPRRRTTEANWRKPFKWDQAACEAKRIDSVFCASLADWADKEVPNEWRDDLFDKVVTCTPSLEWLLLSKRQALVTNYLKRFPCPLPNVRIGVTVENQAMAELRLPHLTRLALAGWKTFVSFEPALGPVNWDLFLDPDGIFGGCIGWLISGGESGTHARPSHPAWFRSARDACANANVPYLHKQNGEWVRR